MHKWEIPSDQKVYSNCITFRWNRKRDAKVQFIEYCDRYEVYRDNEEHHCAIREELDKAVSDVFVKEKEKPLKASYCKCEISKPHFGKIMKPLNIHQTKIYCLGSECDVECRPSNLSWFDMSNSVKSCSEVECK